MDLIWDIVAVAVGAIVGSFLNVCICRIPEENESIVKPASRCPSCRSSIKPYDNVPVLSYLILKGKCRNCGCRISFRYPSVELFTGLMGLFCLWKFDPTLQALGAFVFVCTLIVVTFIDIDHQIIPDVISLPGIPIFLLIAIFVMHVPWRDAVLGLFCGGGVLYAVAVGYELVTKREGMGGGDIKLLGMLGAFLGWKSLLFIMLVSSLSGAAVGMALIAIKGRDMKYALPFGPFLSLAAVLYLFVGDPVIQYFLGIA